MFKRKHYLWLAIVIKASVEKQESFYEFIDRLCIWLKIDSPKFDRGRFLLDAGLLNEEIKNV